MGGGLSEIEIAATARLCWQGFPHSNAVR